MNNAALAYSGKNYLIKEIMEATPQKLLIKVYDFALVQIKKKDFVKTNNAIQVLIDSLRFEPEQAKEISIGLLKLYKFCQDQMRQKNYEIVYTILSDLKNSWNEVFNSQRAAA
jgi:flagellar protein FliS